MSESSHASATNIAEQAVKLREQIVTLRADLRWYKMMFIIWLIFTGVALLFTILAYTDVWLNNFEIPFLVSLLIGIILDVFHGKNLNSTKEKIRKLNIELDKLESPQ